MANKYAKINIFDQSFLYFVDKIYLTKYQN